MTTKDNEVNYVDHLTAEEKEWLYTKPFGKHNLHESYLRIRDFSYIIELLSLDKIKNISLLDLGCGPGWTSIMMAKLGILVTGVDISPKMIAIAKEKAKKEDLKIKFIASDIEKLNLNNEFDRILSYDALHHCPDEKKVLKNVYRALKPGGIVLIVEPNTAHGQNPDSQKAAKRFGVLEKGYSPTYLKELMKKIGFKNITFYDCDYRLNKPLMSGIKYLLKQIMRLVVGRFFWSNFSLQVWLTAEK